MGPLSGAGQQHNTLTQLGQENMGLVCPIGIPWSLGNFLHLNCSTLCNVLAVKASYGKISCFLEVLGAGPAPALWMRLSLIAFKNSTDKEGNISVVVIRKMVYKFTNFLASCICAKVCDFSAGLHHICLYIWHCFNQDQCIKGNFNEYPQNV